MITDEEFSASDVKHAIQQFLEYGENSFHDGGHKGYFSGGGWAARCLRSHLSHDFSSNPTSEAQS